MASRRTPQTCACGCTYQEHRLGMTFAEARRMMWDQEDPNRPGWWRQKRRRGVLGFMRELKIHSFYAIHRYCEEMYQEAA
ncbi:MAG TPA: hypothetical protein VLE97_06105 [Gaiellaceae bacterium]|nr:hypothetical protein [Gaiellaceae bacterium]